MLFYTLPFDTLASPVFACGYFGLCDALRASGEEAFFRVAEKWILSIKFFFF
jgi:hypothetical protein